MALEQYCAACTYLGESCNYDGKYYCELKGPMYACDPKCTNFCEAYSRSNSARENMYGYSCERKNSGGCYITTIICHVLGYDDNNYYLRKLREFRNKMKNNACDLPLLLTYDQVGPKIAEAILADRDANKVALGLLNHYIIPAVSAIEEDKDNLAKNIYIAMTDTLAKYYYIDTNIIIPEEIDKENLGHARVRKPQTNY